MFRSSASLMAEDVTVRCRVRKLSSNTINGDGTINRKPSPKKLNIDFDNAEATIIEMTCTMRNWGTSQYQQSSSRNMMLRNAFSLSNPDIANDTSTISQSSSKVFHSDSAIDVRDSIHSKSDHPTGPELLFTPTYDVSPSKSTRVHVSRRISPISLQPYSIPVSEILLVTYAIANKSDHERTVCHTKMHITTLSLGHYDMDCITSNGHDIVLAFLRASMPQERMVQHENKNSSNSPHIRKKSKRKSTISNNLSSEHDADEIPSVHSNNSSVASSCFDIDALQAKHLAGRAEAETWYEKIQRRYGHVVSNILEQFDSCCNNTTTKGPQHQNPNGPASDTAATIHRTEQVYESTSNKNPNAKLRSPVSTPKRNMSNGITGCLYGELEIDDNATDCSRLNHSPLVLSHRPQKMILSTKSSPLPPKHKNHQHCNIGSSQPPRDKHNTNLQEKPQLQQIRIAHMPSGLSVEPEPYDTDSVR